MASLLQCTVDGGRLHVSYEGLSLGSIDSYNNFLTRGVASMYNWSVTRVINGKSRDLDRADFAKWISKHTIEKGVTEQNVDQFKNFHAIKIKPDRAAPTAQSCLSPSKIEKLTQKLIKSLYEGKFEKAEKCVLQGAKLDRVFWTRGKLGLCFADPMKGFANEAIDVEIRTYTPLLLAGEKKAWRLCEYMKKLGAETQAVGEVKRFTRTIVKHNEHRNLELMPVVRRDEKGNVSSGTHLGTRITQTLLFEDAVCKQSEIVFSPEANVSIERALSNTETTKRQFEVPMSDVRVDHGKLF